MTIAGSILLYALGATCAIFAARYMVAQLFVIPDYATRSHREWIRRGASSIAIGAVLLIIAAALVIASILMLV